MSASAPFRPVPSAVFASAYMVVEDGSLVRVALSGSGSVWCWDARGAVPLESLVPFGRSSDPAAQLRLALSSRELALALRFLTGSRWLASATWGVASPALG